MLPRVPSPPPVRLLFLVLALVLQTAEAREDKKEVLGSYKDLRSAHDIIPM